MGAVITFQPRRHPQGRGPERAYVTDARVLDSARFALLLDIKRRTKALAADSPGVGSHAARLLSMAKGVARRLAFDRASQDMPGARDRASESQPPARREGRT